MTDQEIIDRVRLLLGGVLPSVIPDEVIDTFLQMWKISFNYPNDESKIYLVIYNTLVSSARWLVAKDISSGESTVTRRREKINQEEIEVEYSTNSISSWQDFLDYLEANPNYVDPTLDTVRGLILIGGVRQDAYHAIKHDSNSKDTYSSGSVMDRHPQNIFRNPSLYPFRR